MVVYTAHTLCYRSNVRKMTGGDTVNVALGSDHAGLELKTQIAAYVTELGHEIRDLGPMSYDPLDDYPDYAERVAAEISNGHAVKGLLVCGSGVGASITANKVKGVRAAICHDTYSAHQGVQHDDMNILCIGSRVVGIELARELVATFLTASFSQEERHQRRLDKVLAIETSNFA